MITERYRLLALGLFFLLGGTPSPACAQIASDNKAAGVHALFDLGTPAGGPFPSNHFTVADRSHNTGLRVNLPQPDCKERPSDCEDLDLINTLDGFNVQPRLSIPFDGSIDVKTVTSETVFLISLGSTLHHGERGGRVVGINQVVWDTFTNMLHVKSDEVLDQHTRYALIVTRGVRDESGAPVEASAAFRRFRQTVRGEYKQALLEAIHAARQQGVREQDIVAASVFTTLSTTAILEKIRDQIKAATPEPADFRLGPDGRRTVFALDTVADLTWNQQTGDNPPRFTTVPLGTPLAWLRIIPGVVGQIAFGRYRSPEYMTAERIIPPVGTRTGRPEVQRVSEPVFCITLPAGPKPAGGWPVAIVGYGTGGSNMGAFSRAASLAAEGMATITINMVGHGFGPLSTLTVHPTSGDPVTFPSGGRGMDLNGDGVIGSIEGFAPLRRQILATGGLGREGQMQAVVDLIQLVRMIEMGIDVDGDGQADLDPSRIYYHGFSQGAIYGIPFLAVEPDVRAGAVQVGGGPLAHIRRMVPSSRGAVLGQQLASRVPSLINAPGITELGGLPVSPPYFNENLPLPDQPPVINAVPGAMAIQEVIERSEWFTMPGDLIAYAPHLWKRPLPGVPAKSVLIGFARGDQNVPNPTTIALLRAGDLADRATLYRHDLAYAEDPMIPKNPHDYTVTGFFDDARPLYYEITLGTQTQMAVFLASDGVEIIHPEPRRFFEVPVVPPLPEEFGFIP